MNQLNTTKQASAIPIAGGSLIKDTFVGKYGAWALPMLLLLSFPFFSTNSFYVHLAVLICLNVIVVSGLSFLSRTGQLSFCHAAFIGMGAYVSVIATTRLEMPFLASVFLGVLVASGVAFVLGAVILRLKGVYFVLVTFCFGELFRLFLLEGGDITGGANGIANIPPVELFGVVLDTKLSFYCLAATVAVASVWLLVAFFNTPAGTTLDAVGDNPELAEASGLSVQRAQMFAFVLGSGMAGLGGALFGHYLGFVSPESFNQHASIAVIIMLVMGGRSSVAGPIVGALIMTPLPELFRSAIETQNIFYGATLILILRFLPRGLVSIRADFGKRRGVKT